MSDDSVQVLIKKRREGAKLSPKEEETLRAYFQKYNERTAKIYFPTAEDLAAYKQQSEEGGYGTFSKFVVEKLELALSGNYYDPDYIGELRSQIQDLRKDFERERDNTEHYRQKARALEEKLLEYSDAFFWATAEQAKRAKED